MSTRTDTHSHIHKLYSSYTAGVRCEHNLQFVASFTWRLLTSLLWIQHQILMSAKNFTYNKLCKILMIIINLSGVFYENNVPIYSNNELQVIRLLICIIIIWILANLIAIYVIHCILYIRTYIFLYLFQFGFYNKNNKNIIFINKFSLKYTYKFIVITYVF